MHEAFIQKDPLKFFVHVLQAAVLISGLGHIRIHVRKTTGFLLCLDSVMIPELILVTDRTV